MPGELSYYQEQRAAFAQKRRLYVELLPIYQAMGEHYRALCNVLLQYNRLIVRGDMSSPEERQALQRQHDAILSELAELRLQAQSLSAEIAALQQHKPKGTDPR